MNIITFPFRSISPLLVLFLFSSNIKAQDILKLRSGDEIKTKVIEVSTIEIKYKKFDNIDGPVYSVNKADVKEITYQNGTKDVFRRFEAAPPQKSETAKENEVQPVIKENEELLNKRKQERIEAAQITYDKNMRFYQNRIKSGTKLTIIGVPLLVSGIALTIGGAVLMDAYDPGGYNGITTTPKTGNLGAALGLLIPGVLMCYPGIALTVVGAVKLGTAPRYKERAMEAKALLSFEPSIKPNYFNAAMANPGYNSGVSMKITF